MLGAEQASLSAGRHALAWVLGQTDVWYLLYRCAHYVSKGKGPAQTGVAVLDNLFTLEEDLHDTPGGLDDNTTDGEGKLDYCAAEVIKCVCYLSHSSCGT